MRRSTRWRLATDFIPPRDGPPGMFAISWEAFDRCESASAKALYAFCARTADPEGWLPTPQELGRRFHLSSRVLNRSLSELVEKGIVERHDDAALPDRSVST